MNELPKRKRNRLESYDYSQNGAYFITICTKDKRKLLGTVGRDDLGTPFVTLSKQGSIAQKNIDLIELHYKCTLVDKYIIMPNHIHMIIVLSILHDGVPRSSRPTAVSISSIVAAFKKFTAKEMGINIWQTSFHDHVIRDEEDYLRIWQYTDENPAKWAEDAYFV